MFRQLLAFEWRYHTHKLFFPFVALIFLFLGFMFTVAAYMPTVHINSAWSITYTLGVLSMGGLFPATVFAANAMLRDPDHLMREMVYATPISKGNFLLSRFLGVLLASSCISLSPVVGMLLGSLYPGLDAEMLGPFELRNYLWPLLTHALPNICYATTLMFLLAGLAQNRIAIYLGGLFLYVLYVVGSMFSNAPWLAGVSPATAEAMALSAKIDPFGLSAFFEQSKYWTTLERNTELISFSGNFLINRILWAGISFILMAITYVGFSFRTEVYDRKRATKAKQESLPLASYRPVSTTPFTRTSQLQSLCSLIQLEFKAIVKSLPFLVAMAIWALLIGSETWASILGGARMPDEFPMTGNLVSNLIFVIPFFGILLVIFYSNEQIWRTRLLNMDALSFSTPVSNWVLYVSKLGVLLLIPICMITIGIIVSILIQLIRGFWEVEIGLYLSAFYYAGIPLFCVAILALFLQSLFHRRYIGMLFTAIFLLIGSSQLGSLFGINHPLFKFARPLLETSYSELNGFGVYGYAFHWRMLYWGSFSILFAFLTYALWNRRKNGEIKDRLKHVKRNLGRKGQMLVLLCGWVFIGSGGYIFYKTNLEEPYITTESLNDWSQSYEEKYQRYEHIAQPIPIRIFTEIALYPSENKYEVEATYTLKNKSETPLSEALLGLHTESRFRNVDIEKADIIERDERFGQYMIRFQEPLQPGEEFEMNVAFFSEWNGFNPHVPFNSIIENGSFIRMSRYFPFFGYNADYELSNEDIRRERGLPPKKFRLKPLDGQTADSLSYSYDYIDFESIISTSLDQRAIGSGKLIKSWKDGERNYFHYKMDRLIPNRFAVASARFAVEKLNYRNVNIEVYYHPRHAYNIDRLLKACKETLDYCIDAFGPYQYEDLRFVEVADFTSGFAATAYPHTLFIRESMGFFSDMRREGEIDILNQLVGHEVSHQWWAGQVAPPHQEGGIVLTETLAQYTEFMIYEKAAGKEAALAALNVELDLYLRNRGFHEEVPLLFAGNTQPYIPYSKGAKVMYAIREMIGEEQLNQALKNLIKGYAFPQSPPTSWDLLEEILAVADPIWEKEIRDMFEKILLYDAKILETQVSKGEDAYEVSLKVLVQKTEVAPEGKLVSVTPNDSIQIGLFKREEVLSDAENILYLQRHRILADTTELTVRLDEKPGFAGIDPFVLLIDTDKTNNIKSVGLEE